MKRTVKRVAQRALSTDRKLRKIYQKLQADSYQNFAAAIGNQTSTLSSASTYQWDPISRLRVVLEWIHRGSWLGGMAVDLVADDMTRAGVVVRGEMPPEQIAKIQETATNLGVWNAINDTIKWGRLYGGGLGVLLIQGQNYQTPLRIETVAKGQFRGIYAMDRWMVEPSLNNLVTEPGPFLGLPTFYKVTSDAPALNGKIIHYTRIFRMEGIRLPFQQRLMENLWSASIIERLKDRMESYDSATLGAAQLCYKAYLRTYKIKGLRELIAAGGPGYAALLKQVQFMRTTQTNEGMTLLDGDDEFQSDSASGAISGIDDVLLQLGQQLAGALQIPLVRLFGQSPGGLNSTGESDVRTYYDGIMQQQVRWLQNPVTLIYRAIAQSEGFKPPEGFGITFRPLWQLSEDQKAAVAGAIAEAVTKAHDLGALSDQSSMKELKQSSEITGVFTNITDDDISAADDVPAPKIDELVPGEGGDDTRPPKAKKKSKDAADKLELECALVEGR